MFVVIFRVAALFLLLWLRMFGKLALAILLFCPPPAAAFLLVGDILWEDNGLDDEYDLSLDREGAFTLAATLRSLVSTGL